MRRPPIQRARRGRVLSALVLAGCVAGPALAQAPATTEPSWRETKCAHYRAAWTDALAHQGRQGLGPDFLQRHDAFLASDCTGPHDVCPRSPEELRLANTLLMASMNFRTASTFAPFGCGR